jgi:hypothetical protein
MIYMLLVPAGQTGEAWEPSKKQAEVLMVFEGSLSA